MSKVIASITTSVDGYVAGPDDGPELAAHSSPFATHVTYAVRR